MLCAVVFEWANSDLIHQTAHLKSVHAVVISAHTVHLFIHTPFNDQVIIFDDFCPLMKNNILFEFGIKND